MMNFFTSKGLLKGVFPEFNEFQDISVNINFNVSQVWSGLDIANFVLGLIDGALSALPQGSAGYWCSKNSTSSRISFTNAVSAFNNNNDISVKFIEFENPANPTTLFNTQIILIK